MVKRGGGIRFEDIIAGQQRLAAQGDSKAAQQVQAFQAMARTAEEQLAVANQTRNLTAAEVAETDATRREEKQMHDDIKKGLVNTTGDGLNSNVIKLGKELKKALGKLPSEAGKFSPENRGKLSEDLMAQSEKYVRGPRDLIPNLKEKFSFSNIMRGVEGEGTGLIGTFLKKRRIKNQYIEDQQAMGNTGSRKEIGQQFEKLNQLRKTMGKDVAERDRLKKEGYSDEQIDRTGVTARILRTQTSMKEVDPLLAERNPVGPQDARSNLITPDTDGGFTDGMTGAETEAAAENSRLMNEQTDTLKKIEENTRGLADALKGVLGKTGETAAEDQSTATSPISRISSLKNILRRGGGLLRRGAGVLKSVAGKALLPLAAGQAIYSGVSDMAAGKGVNTAGEIVPEGLEKLNPFAWAMRGGMYAGGKINQGYGKLSTMLGGSGELGSDVYDGVQKAKSVFTMENLKKAGSTVATALTPGAGIMKQGMALGSNMISGIQSAAARFSAGMSDTGTYDKLGMTYTQPLVAPKPRGADVVYKKSADVAMLTQGARKDATTLVNAPTTINKTTQMYTSPPKARNQESSISEFLKNKYR